MKKLQVEVWSDVVCPWCYVGKRRLEAALEQFPHRADTEVVWRAFELDPASPRERDRSVSSAERLSKKYGMPLAQANAAIARMTDTAREDGLTFEFDRTRPGNTFDAHRVIHLGLERGLQDAVKERLLLGYMTEGEAIGDPEVLVRLGADAGLDGDEVRAVLSSDTYAQEVRADEREARELGIGGVPFFVLGGRIAVSGAQPAEVLSRALTQAWKEIEPQVDLPGSFESGAVCGPDGCA